MKLADLQRPEVVKALTVAYLSSLDHVKYQSIQSLSNMVQCLNRAQALLKKYNNNVPYPHVIDIESEVVIDTPVTPEKAPEPEIVLEPSAPTVYSEAGGGEPAN